jgi:hypothetical protein
MVGELTVCTLFYLALRLCDKRRTAFDTLRCLRLVESCTLDHSSNLPVWLPCAWHTIAVSRQHAKSHL